MSAKTINSTSQNITQDYVSNLCNKNRYDNVDTSVIFKRNQQFDVSTLKKDTLVNAAENYQISDPQLKPPYVKHEHFLTENHQLDNLLNVLSKRNYDEIDVFKLSSDFSKNYKQAITKGLELLSSYENIVEELNYNIELLTLSTETFKRAVLASPLDKSQNDLQKLEISSSISKNERNIAIIDELTNQADSIYKKINSHFNSLGASPIINSDICEKHTNAIAKYLLLVLENISISNANNISSIKGQCTLTKLMNEARLSEYKTKSQEAEKKSRTAKRINKFLSIFGAIMGAVISVASLVAAVPTAGASTGASVAFFCAVTATTVMLADTITSLTTDFSFMGKSFEFVIEKLAFIFQHTVGELIELIAEKGFGAKKEDAQKANEYFSMAAAYISIVVIMIVVTRAAGGSGSTGQKGAEGLATNASSQAANAGSSVVSNAGTSSAKVAQEMIKQEAENTVKNVNKSILAEIAKYVAAFSGVLDGLLVGGLKTTSGVYTRQYYNLNAEMKLTEEEINILNKLRSYLFEQIKDTDALLMEMSSQVTDIIKERKKALESSYQNFTKA